MVALLALVPFVLSLIIMLLIGAPLIRWLKFRPGMKWTPREDTPETHNLKAGVPSMGGIGIIISALLAWSLWAAYSTLVWYRGTPPPLSGRIAATTFGVLAMVPVITLGHMILGYVDDLSKAQKRGGISSRQKLLGQTVLAVLFCVGLWFLTESLNALKLEGGDVSFFGVWWMWPLILLVIIGTSNAVNLTDGIDGLASGLCVQVAGVFLFLMASPENNRFHGVTSHSAALLWLTLGGACLGFLWFNKYPAKVFMGDTGSLALGAALGAGAIASQTVFLLPFIGFIFFVEMFSVIFQVAYFKYTKRKTGEGKRIFRRAPLHHHFELGGWSEKKVVAVFWIVNLFTSAIGIWLWQSGFLPRFP